MLTVPLGAALAIELSLLYADPASMILYAPLAGLLALSGCLFIFSHSKYNSKEDDMDRLVIKNERRNAKGNKKLDRSLEGTQVAGRGIVQH